MLAGVKALQRVCLKVFLSTRFRKRWCGVLCSSICVVRVAYVLRSALLFWVFLSCFGDILVLRVLEMRLGSVFLLGFGQRSIGGVCAEVYSSFVFFPCLPVSSRGVPRSMVAVMVFDLFFFTYLTYLDGMFMVLWCFDSRCSD